MRGDLHVHSTASDGTLSPAELVAAALAAGIEVLAIADHDTVAGQSEARLAAQATPLRLIPAVELSCLIEDSDVHILGYHIDDTNEALRASLEGLKQARVRRAHAVVSALRSAGFSIDIEDVFAHAGKGAVGRSHIARALVSRGHAAHASEAFERFIGRGQPFYIAKEAQTASEAIDLIHAAGGAAFVAHPGIGDAARHLDTLCAAGIDGVEAFHADHSAEQRVAFSDYAASRGLMTSGGTDFHGPYAPNPPLGSIDVPEAAVATLVAWTPVPPVG